MTQFAIRASQSRFTISALLVLVSLAAVTAHAQNRITQCDTVITSPGEYVLANDLSDCRSGITIRNTFEVVVRLDGHSITGSGMQSSDGIATSGIVARIHIVGPGTISNFRGLGHAGIFLSSRSDQDEVTGVTSTGNFAGFLIGMKAGQVRGNFATNNDHEGFVLEGMDSPVEFSDNLATGNHEYGIVILCCSGGWRVTNNIAASNGYGIATGRGAHGNTIDSNHAIFNDTYDVIEYNSTCENTWRDNTYFTSHGPCFP